MVNRPVSDTASTLHPSLANAVWLTNALTQTVLSCLTSAGFEARVVGGAIRNALLGHAVNDIDIATTAEPDDIIKAAETSGLKAVPTGIDHGTVTIVADSTPFEVTTLRRDVETFGRRARVAFTSDWDQDAKRRDFTINALYCDSTGRLFDPVGGLADLKRKRVRFIGEAGAHIEEDYLRILRFFRFTATYSDGALNAEGLASCIEHRSGLDQLSGERIASELKRLLTAPNMVAVIDDMQRGKILKQIFKRDCNVKHLHQLANVERALKRTPDPLVRLAALCVDDVSDAVALRQRLKLSSRDFDRLARLGQNPPGLNPATPELEARAFIYHHGVEAYRDGLLFAWARADALGTDQSWQERFTLPDRWTAPQFPLTGSDVLAVGIPPGPAVGRALSTLERWWIGENFPQDRARALNRLTEISKVTKT